MAGQNIAHPRDEIAFGNGDLCRPAFAPFGIVFDLFGKARAFDQILDGHLALRALVLALDDDTGRAALVGIFHLRTHAGFAEIHFGANTRSTQIACHFLIGRQLLAVHDEHNHGTQSVLSASLTQRNQRRMQPRDTDRIAGCRNADALEALDEPVIAATAADRAEARLTAIFAGGLEGELGLENGTSVIIEPAHNGGIDPDTVAIEAGCAQQFVHRPKLGQALAARFTLLNEARQGVKGLPPPLASGAYIAQNHVDLIRRKTRALGVIAGLVLAPFPEQHADRIDAEPVKLVDGTQHGHSLPGAFGVRRIEAGKL